MDISLSKLQETVEERGAHGVAKSQNPGKEHPLIEFRSLYVSAGREWSSPLGFHSGRWSLEITLPLHNKGVVLHNLATEQQQLPYCVGEG